MVNLNKYSILNSFFIDLLVIWFLQILAFGIPSTKFIRWLQISQEFPWDICKHLINLVEGIPKAKIWRNQISNKSIKKELNIEYLFKLTTTLEEMGY